MSATKKSGPTVSVKQGTLMGTTGTNLDGEEFYKFLGIPFAKPPVGPLRFKAPQPPEPWEGIRDCTKDGSPNLMFDFRTRGIVGSEDCLFLNVHTKTLPTPGAPLKPVLAYIHGGAFTMGSGTQEMAGPEYIMIQDVVLVSMNYRLGVFGFLSLEDTGLEVPGNAGLKDQTQALKWVQENIAQFGGDPNNVTIFGISAGGTSVQFQLISPAAKGLFHKAIAQSGSVFNPWAWGQRNAIQIAEKLGKKVSSEKEALEVIMQTPAEELYKATQGLTDCLILPDVRRPFGPVIEKPNPTAFLSEDPADILSSGRYNQVPLIQGVCSNEGLIRDFSMFLSIPEDFAGDNHLIPWNINHKHPSLPKWEKAVRALYYEGGLSRIAEHQHIGDTAFNIGVVESVKLALKNSQQPIYFYQFSYETDKVKNFRKMIQLGDDITGVSHGGDQGFLFPSNFFGTDPLTAEDMAAIKTVVGIWADFARTGVPHPKWKPITNPDDLHYLNLAEELELHINPFEDRMKVWGDIIKEAGGFDLRIDESS